MRATGLQERMVQFDEEFWAAHAVLYRCAEELPLLPAMSGRLSFLIDAALRADEPIEDFVIETDAGQQFVGREITRVACDATRPGEVPIESLIHCNR